MAWFFTKAALLTFGGAYAVLPYVYQGAVEHYQWLTARADDRRPGARRDDARAAHHGGVLRRLRRRLDQGHLRRRTRCSCRARSPPAVVTFFTFLPSFFFILLGGPFIESTHGKLKFTAPLTGITAAVVGRHREPRRLLRVSRALAAGARAAASTWPSRPHRRRPRPSRCSASRSASSPSSWPPGLAGLALTFLRPCLHERIPWKAESANLPFDPVRAARLDERLLRSHHQNNYGGAVRRLNAIRARAGRDVVRDHAGLRAQWPEARRAGRHQFRCCLHELYFDSLGGDGQAMAPAMELALQASFGSVERWRDEFVAMGKALAAARAGCCSPSSRATAPWSTSGLRTTRRRSPAACPILALDMYEHAYHLDFGAAAGAYVDAFMDNIDWASRVRALPDSPSMARASPSAANRTRSPAALLLDVRRAGVVRAGDDPVAGARWRDPATVDNWAGALPSDRDVVSIASTGTRSGRATALRLRAAGLNARFLRGGIDGWQAAGRALEPRGQTS